MTWLVVAWGLGAWGLWACGEGVSYKAPSLEFALISPAEMLEYEPLGVRQTLWEELLTQAQEQALNPSYVQPLFPMLTPSGFVAKAGPEALVRCFNEPFVAPEEETLTPASPEETLTPASPEETLAPALPEETLTPASPEEVAAPAPEEEAATLKLKFDERKESWSDVQRDDWRGLSERDVARCLASHLLTQWQITGEVSVQKVARSLYAAAYVDGSLRLNPAFVALAAVSF